MNTLYLECAACDLRYEANQLANLCVECEKPLSAKYDLEKAKETLTKDSLKRAKQTFGVTGKSCQ